MPVAKRGAMLYAVISSLRGIQREYQFSLPFFLWMFDQAVGEEPTESQDDSEQGQVCKLNTTIRRVFGSSHII